MFRVLDASRSSLKAAAWLHRFCAMMAPVARSITLVDLPRLFVAMSSLPSCVTARL